MQETTNEPAVIPYAAHEAQMERNAKQVRLLTKIIGVMALLMFLMAVMFTYGWEEEVTTTTTTTTEEVTTDESVTQDSGDGGSNIYAGGDYNGNPNGQ